MKEIFVFHGALLDFDVEISCILGEDGADAVDLGGLLKTGCEFDEGIEEVFRDDGCDVNGRANGVE